MAGLPLIAASTRAAAAAALAPREENALMVLEMPTCTAPASLVNVGCYTCGCLGLLVVQNASSCVALLVEGSLAPESWESECLGNALHVHRDLGFQGVPAAAWLPVHMLMKMSGLDAGTLLS